MDEKMKKEYTAYEYKAVTVHKEREGLWHDSMKNFGWMLEKSKPAVVKRLWLPLSVMLAPLALLPGSQCDQLIRDHDSKRLVELTFKRERNIPGKTELNRLQAEFEQSALAIDALTASEKSPATAAAYATGIIGTVLMGAAVFSMLANLLPLSVVLAVPAFAGWILPVFLYRSLKTKKTAAVVPQIEKQYDAIYEICREADEILNMAC